MPPVRHEAGAASHMKIGGAFGGADFLVDARSARTWQGAKDCTNGGYKFLKEKYGWLRWTQSVAFLGIFYLCGALIAHSDRNGLFALHGVPKRLF